MKASTEKTKTSTKKLPAIIACGSLLLIMAFGFVASMLQSNRPLRMGAVMLSGCVMVLLIQLVKEKTLRKWALPIYIVVVAVLIFHRLIAADSFPPSLRFLSIGDAFYIYTAALLPFAALFPARIIQKCGEMDIKQFLLFCGITALPALIVIAQVNYKPVILSALVILAVIMVLISEKKIKRPGVAALILGGVGLVLIGLYVFKNYNYVCEVLETVFTRGKNDPLYFGWQRSVLDTLFKNAKLVGEADVVIGGRHITEIISMWGESSLPVVLAKYGWLAFGGVLAAYIVFILALLQMCNGLHEKVFAKYTAIFCTLYLAGQAALSIASMLIMDTSYIDMPFAGLNHTQTIVNFLCFGIVLSLYLKRNNEPEEDDHEPNSIFSRFLSADDSDDIDYDDDIVDDPIADIPPEDAESEILSVGEGVE